MDWKSILEIDPVLHAPIRLAVVVFLVQTETTTLSTLVSESGLNSGVLSSNLRRLESAGYIQMEKTFRDRKTEPRYRLTRKGQRALFIYFEKANTILTSLQVLYRDPNDSK